MPNRDKKKLSVSNAMLKDCIELRNMRLIECDKNFSSKHSCLLSCLDCLFFKSSNGKPRKILRVMFFHKSGKPRGVFKKFIQKPDGSPKPAFKRWMTGQDYMSLPWSSNKVVDDNIGRKTVSGLDFELFIKRSIMISSEAPAMYRPFSLIEDKRSAMWNKLQHGQGNINISLIDSLRRGDDISFNRKLNISDQPFIDLMVDHLYLAYLRRFPSFEDCRAKSNAMLASNELKSIIESMKSSEEYASNGHRWIKK